jgi:LPPG:FO 2-phospho-L-lactate transferase
MSVVVLAGGTGGAKLARGMLDVVGEELVVVANTGDDIEIYGAHVSPDPDLCAFALIDRLNAAGWGLEGDTFEVMAGLRDLGIDVWFNLGDRDLAIALERAARLAVGERLTTVHLDLMRALGVPVPVLPMCDEPVRTLVRTDGEWREFQEFMIRLGGAAEDFDRVEGVELRGIEAARMTPEVRDALAEASVIVVGPSNPVISIGPILGVPGMRAALREAPAPVVAVSPIVAGASLKGPTVGFMAWAGHAASSEGIAALYGGVLDGIVVHGEEQVGGLPVLRTDTVMSGPEERRRLAAETLDFARALAP